MSKRCTSAQATKMSQECGELILVGMGLWSHDSISLSGLHSARRADEVYAELYTSIMPALNISHLERRIGKRITILGRRDLEEGADSGILRNARGRRIVLLVPGDPLAATTHVTLRLRASELGIGTRVIHSASIFSAAPSIAGLQQYKFGKTVTIPFPREGYLPPSPYDAVLDNLGRGLHTLVLLDLDVENGKYLSISEALSLLRKIEAERRKKVLSDDRLVIGVARVGSPKPLVKCGYVMDLMKTDFGAPPHTLIIPGELHFMEAEALVKLLGVPRSILSKNITAEKYQDF